MTNAVTAFEMALLTNSAKGRRQLSFMRSAIVTHPDLMIFVIAFFLRLAWVLTLENGLVWVDEREFVEVARHLASGEGYVSPSYRANPVLPFYLSMVFRVFGESYLGARIGQSIIGALTCVLIFRIGSLLISPLAGVLSGLILACYLPHIYLAGVFYVDCWLTFFCALSVYVAAVTHRPGQLRFGLLCGLSLGLTALTRGLFVVAAPAVCLAWMAAGRLARSRLMFLCLALAAGWTTVVLPWALRNHQVYGHPILVTSGFYTYLWRGNNELATGGAEDRVITWNAPAWKERLEQLPSGERGVLQQRYEAIDNLLAQRRKELGDRQLAEDEVLRSVVIKLLLSDPLRTGTLMLKKVLTLFSAFSQTYSTNEYTTASRRLLAAVSFYPVLALALLGAGLGLPRWRELALIYLVPGAVILSYALLVACTRFRLAVDPYLIMFASLALSRGWALVPVGRSAEARGGFPCDPDEHALAWQRSETHRGEGGGHRGSPH